MAKAVRVPLDVWQDPQGAVVLEWSDSECCVYFACWDGAGIPADFLCELTFQRAVAVRGERSEYAPYDSIGDVGPSYLLGVPDSEWLTDVRERQQAIYGSRATALDDAYLHLVVVGHDNSVQVLCTGFATRRIPLKDAGRLARLIDGA